MQMTCCNQSCVQRDCHNETAVSATCIWHCHLQEPGQLDPNLCVMLAEAAAKAAEHVALLQILQPPKTAGADSLDDADGEDDETGMNAARQLWSFSAALTPWFVPLMEARTATGEQCDCT